MNTFSRSILESISQQVFSSRTPDQAKNLIKERVEMSQIEKKDKYLILQAVDRCRTLIQVQTYLTNSLLRFEGMSLNKYEK